MFRALMIGTALLSLASALLAQPAVRKRQVTAAAPARAADIAEITEEAVEELEKWWVANLLDYGDPTDSKEAQARREAARNKLENLYDLSFRYVNSDNTTDTRSAHFKKLRSRQLQYQQIEIKNREITVERARTGATRSVANRRTPIATATVTCEATLSFRLTNERASTPISYKARLTHQWVWVDRWQLVKHQTERIK
jgi:hypothetical protein